MLYKSHFTWSKPHNLTCSQCLIHSCPAVKVRHTVVRRPAVSPPSLTGGLRVRQLQARNLGTSGRTGHDRNLVSGAAREAPVSSWPLGDRPRLKLAGPTAPLRSEDWRCVPIPSPKERFYGRHHGCPGVKSRRQQLDVLSVGRVSRC